MVLGDTKMPWAWEYDWLDTAVDKRKVPVADLK
jgi:hypothetical protein